MALVVPGWSSLLERWSTGLLDMTGYARVTGSSGRVSARVDEPSVNRCPR